MKKIRIATRGSHLALAQAKYIENLLNKENVYTEIIIIKTTGDKNYASFTEIAKKGDETKGLFTKEIEEALINNQADIAVHSLKDLPSISPEELTIVALPQRLDFRDYWIYPKDKKIQDHFPFIKHDGIVGTSSSRRKSLIQYLIPSLKTVDIRGNVPTRIKKLFSNNGPDAILLSGAGLERLSNESNWIEKEFLEKIQIYPLDPEWFPPTPGQGTLAVQCRVDDEEIIEILKKFHNKEIENIIKIERGLLAKLKGGCHLPLGVHAKYNQNYQTYQANVFLGKDYLYNSKQKDFYITRFHDNPEELVNYIYEELTENISIVIFGKKEKNDLLSEKFSNLKDKVFFYNILETIYLDSFIKKNYNQFLYDKNKTTIYAIFSAEGIRSLKKCNFTFSYEDILFLNGAKSREILLDLYPNLNNNKIFLSNDGTATSSAMQIKNQFKADEVQIIAITSEETRNDFFDILIPLNYKIEQWIVYKTKKRILEKNEIESIPKNAYLIFGSPSIFETFLQSFNQNQIDFFLEFKNTYQWKLVALGKTTFFHIRKYNLPIYAMAKEPDYEKLIREFI